MDIRFADVLVDAYNRVYEEPEWAKRARWFKQDGYSIRWIAKRLNRSHYMITKVTR